MVRTKLMGILLGGLLALGLFAGVATTFAQSDDAVTAQTTPTVPDTSTRGSRGSLGVSAQALADALGIELAELTAAQETARLALIDQAVADGHLTAEEGQALKDAGSRLHDSSQYGYDKDEFLADALGISVETLEAAKLEAYEVDLAARVAAGELTQEEADLKLAQKAAQNYLDTDSLNAQVRSAYQAAVAEAVAAGDITQAQADLLLAQLETYSFNFGFGGHGGRGGHGGHGGGRGFGSGTTPTTPETTPDTGTTTDTSFDA